MTEKMKELPINQIIQGDCLEIMPKISDKSIDMILCDLPYGTTACSWDTVIPFEPLWKEYKRIIKDNGAIVLTASQPFTSALVMSNPDMFKYEWIWNKRISGNPMLANQQPMKIHESVLVFGQGKTNYFPIMKKGLFRKKGGGFSKELYNNKPQPVSFNDDYKPVSIIDISNAKRGEHPTQKPVDLFGYLIRTYTNEGDLVLDNCAGSGTTGVAAKQLKRNYILIEKEEKYCKIAENRLRQCNPLL